MTRKLVFWTAFNSYRSEKCLRGLPPGSLHPVTTREWTERRVELWRKFTLNSLYAQIAQDWLYVVLLDPELRHLTEPLLPRRDPRLLYCYEDGPTLERLREYDEIVLALIDGDDMYSRSAGQIMMSCRAEWMYFRYGYAYEAGTKRLWRYDTIGTGPFFAHRLDPKPMTAFDRDKRHPTHKAVAGRNPEILPAGHFCVLLHDTNTSSRPEMRYVLRERPVDLGILKREFGR
jgi:hypothetical protein